MKEMLVSWDILRNANFSPIFFLQGDFGVGTLKIVLRSLEKNFQGNIRAVFCSSSNPTETYVVEKEVTGTSINIDIPNEIFQGFGKVYCRLVLKSQDKTKILDGLMSKEDKRKLDGLNNYTLPVANVNTLGGVKAKNGNAVTIGGDGAIGIDDARTVQSGERDKWNKAATDLPNVKSTADNALAKATTNEQSINTANGKITTLEGKLVYLSIEDARTIINKYKA